MGGKSEKHGAAVNWRWLLLIPAAATGLSIWAASRGDTPTPRPNNPTPADIPAADSLATSFDWRRVGSTARIDVVVKNENSFDVKDMAVHCRFSGKSGTEISSKAYVIFDVVAAGKTRKFPDLNLGSISDQVAKASCRIVAARHR